MVQKIAATLPVMEDLLATTNYQTLVQQIDGKMFYGAKTPKGSAKATSEALNNYIFATPGFNVINWYISSKTVPDEVITVKDTYCPYLKYMPLVYNILTTHNKVVVDYKVLDKFKTPPTPKMIMKHCTAAISNSKLEMVRTYFTDITKNAATTEEKLKAIDILVNQLDTMVNACLTDWRRFADYTVFAGFDNGNQQYIMHIGISVDGIAKVAGITRQEAEQLQAQDRVPYLNYTIPLKLKALLLEQRETLQPTKPVETQPLPKALTTCYQKDLNRFTRGYILPGSGDILTNILTNGDWEYNEGGDIKKMIQAVIPNNIIDTFKLTGVEQNFLRYMTAKFIMNGTGPLARCKLSRKERKKLTITKEDKTFTFDMMHYAKYIGQAQPTGNRDNDYKNISTFKNKLRIILDNLAMPTYKIPTRGGKYIEVGHIIDKIEYPRKGTTATEVTITFGDRWAEQILNYGGKFDLPLPLLQINDKYASYIGPALYDHWAMNKDKLAPDGSTILSVENLIAYPVFNAVNKDRSTTQRPSRQYIEPLENALDKLVKYGVLKGDWQYCNGKGKPLTDEQLKDGSFIEFNAWRQLYIKYSIADIT